MLIQLLLRSKPLSRHFFLKGWFVLWFALTFLSVSTSGGAQKQHGPDISPRALLSNRGPEWNSVKGLEALYNRVKARAEAREKKKEKKREERREARADRKDAKPGRPSYMPKEKEDEDEDETADAIGSYLYFLRQRAYPNDKIDWSAYRRGVLHRARMRPAVIGRARGSAGSEPKGGNQPLSSPIDLGNRWEFLGPQRYDAPYQWTFGLGQINGRVNGVVFHPTAPNTFYLCSAGGGVWKTTNGGVDWTPLSDQWPFMQTTCIALDPVNPQTLYVGTGDFPLYGSYALGVMKSVDGGNTWTNVGASLFGDQTVSRVVVDPDNPQIVTAATGRGNYFWGNIFRSTDGGATWNMAPAPAGADIVSWNDMTIGAKTATGRRYYYASGTSYNSSSGGIISETWRSADRGATWTRLATPAILNDYSSRSAIAASPTQPDTVYLLAAYDQYSNANGKVYRSANGGANWTDITGGDLADASWYQGWYDLFMKCGTRTIGGAPQDVVYVGLIDVLQYTSASGWQSVNKAYTGEDLIHVDSQGFATHPTDQNKFLVGNDGGAFLLNRDPTSGEWTGSSLNNLLGVTQIYHAAFHPTDPNILFCGTQDNGTIAAWGDLGSWYGFTGGDGGYCAIRPSNDLVFTSYIYLTIYYWNGSSWDYISPDIGSDKVAFIAPFLLDPNDDRLLYGASNYLYRWNVDTATWQNRLGNQKLSTYGYIQAIAIAPTDSNRIYTGSSDGELWMSTNKGANWTKINTGSPALPNRAITSIEVSPANPSNILVGVSGFGTGHLFRCSNTQAATRVWTDISGTGLSGLPDVPLNSVTLDPDNPANTYYVGTDIGVFVTTDAGATWENGTQPLGLPNVQVNHVKAVPGTKYLHASTYGRGMWRVPLFANKIETRVDVPDRAGVVGQTVALSATLRRASDSSPLNGKTLTFQVGTETAGTATTNSAGTATLNYTLPPSLNPGSNPLSVTFPGDTDFAASLGTATVTVTFNTLAAVSNATASIGQTFQLRGSLRRYPDGVYLTGKTIAFKVNGEAVGSAVIGTDNLAKLNYTVPESLGAGTKPLRVEFAGDTNFNASAGNATLTVPVTDTTLATNSVAGKIGQLIQLRSTLRRRTDGAFLSGKTIAFTVNGEAVGSAVTASDGVARLTWRIAGTLSVGTPPITGTFAGDANYTTSSGNGVLTVVQTETTMAVNNVGGRLGKGVQLRATLRRRTDAGFIAGRTVVFTVNGELAGSAVTGTDGVAKLDYTIPESMGLGNKTILASFEGDGDYFASSRTGTLTVNP